jgi:hypothetical protein
LAPRLPKRPAKPPLIGMRSSPCWQTITLWKKSCSSNAIQSLPAGAIHISMSTISVALAPVYRNYGGMIAADKFEPVGFSLPLGFKDNRLLLAAAEEAQVPVPMASLVHDRFLAALAQGLGEADWAAIARISFQAAGLLGSAASSKDCS